ncbi:hypothetical protein [Pontibacter sp. SGAir0037]|uniref:hypothetical protein n=1 Tax=Pontibacter sp. SGAir0037 TaxID=2571030 RepID=UPI0010CD2F1E|nr:hypothetical protein [Pontibacter sp. SGAir0037]QCR23077.1 hypothetical protein C1N53_12465 [Pontibacter sp. SGAir0037]
MSATGVIRLTEVLQHMQAGLTPFDIAYVTLDQRRKTGGEIKRYTQCLLSGIKQKKGKATTGANPKPESTSWAKNPNHFDNATRNLTLPNGQKRKLHIWLITEFNGMKVLI